MDRYYPRLDGLRAVAVGLVIIQHFITSKGDLGAFGVRLFFVISGYLITGNLLGLRDTPTGEAAQIFYWRRFLRLAPPFYLTILIVTLLGLGDMRERWWIDALYLTNMRFALNGSWGYAVHFWSLAVEEQFYLLWFAVVILMPKRWLLSAIIVGFLLASALRIVTLLFHLNPTSAHLVVIGSSDFLCAGALISYVEKEWDDRKSLGKWLFNPVVLWSAIAVTIILTVMGWLAHAEECVRLLTALPSVIVASALVLAALENKGGAIGGLLEWPVVRRIGMLSYGIYIYHFFVPEIFEVCGFDPGFHAEGVARYLIRFTTKVMVTLVIAEISFALMERPIRVRFRNFIPVKRASAPPGLNTDSTRSST